MDRKWIEYYKSTSQRPPRPLLVEAISYLSNHQAALDFGSGAFVDSIYLMDHVGISTVTALDSQAYLSEVAAKLSLPGLEYIELDFNEYRCPPETFDLISAQYALSFLSPENAKTIVLGLLQGLKPEGVFSGNFFGTNDDWHSRTNMTFFKKSEVEDIFSELTLLKFEEKEYEKPTAAGHMKFWHEFEVIAKQK